MLLSLMELPSVGHQACVLERKRMFFLSLGVFEPAKPEWAGQTRAPDLVPAGVSVSWVRVGSGERRSAKVQLERKAAGGLVGTQGGGCLLQSQDKHLPERWSPPSLLSPPQLPLPWDSVGSVGGQFVANLTSTGNGRGSSFLG